MNACWAPITSLLSRLISAPVWVRVKNGERHPLHVVEHAGAQVEDEALADARRVPPLDEGEAGVEDGQAGDQDGDLHDARTGRRAS